MPSDCMPVLTRTWTLVTIDFVEDYMYNNKIIDSKKSWLTVKYIWMLW